MKKNISLTLMLFIILLTVLTGCGKKISPQDIIVDVKTNMESVNSMNYDVDFIIDSVQKYEDTKIPIKIQYKLNIDETKIISYITGQINTTISNDNNSYNIEAYQSSENENDLMYFKQDDIWYKQDVENYSTYGMIILKSIYSSPIIVDEDTTVINDKECYVMNIQVSGGTLKELIDIIGQNIEIADEDYVDIKLLTYKDLNYPACLEIDLTNIANKVIDSDELSVSYNEYKITITYNSFNDSTVSLDENIRAEAKRKKENNNSVQGNNNSSGIAPEEQTPEQQPSPGATPIEKPEEDNNDTILDLSEEWNTFQFGYNGAIYRLPMTYQIFENLGYSLKDSEKTIILQPEQDYTTTVYKGKYMIVVKLKNTTASPKTMYECDIIAIDIDTYSLDNTELSEFIFNNSVNFTYTYDMIVEAFGEPTSEHNGAALKIATYQDEDNFIEIYFDQSDLTIIEYKITAQ